MDKPAPHTTA
jgi:D-alanyl-D-alanine carboxypeptidase (penicillin-binding protein 5/6)